MVLTAHEVSVINKAKQILHSKAKETELFLSSSFSKDYWQLRLSRLTHEEMWAAWLNSGGKLIATSRIGIGTVDTVFVARREVIRSALQHNAAMVVLAHNHPSNDAVPSQHDLELTAALKDSFSHIGVQLVDHIVVGTPGLFSFADEGLL